MASELTGPAPLGKEVGEKGVANTETPRDVEAGRELEQFDVERVEKVYA